MVIACGISQKCLMRFKHIAARQNPVPEFCQFTVMDPVDAEIFLSGQINRKQKKGSKCS